MFGPQVYKKTERSEMSGLHENDIVYFVSFVGLSVVSVSSRRRG